MKRSKTHSAAEREIVMLVATMYRFVADIAQCVVHP
jgi:hypothetical protein